MQLRVPQKTIMHLDMNAFFASVEQACNPHLQGKPVAVVPNPEYSGAAILTCSYQAKAKGVKSFSRLGEARLLCPELIAVKPNHLKYYEINARIYKILESYTPIIEIYSVDEFFLDLTDYFQLRNTSPEVLAAEIKQRILHEIHPVLTCSIGISCNKLLAKVGSDYKKPDGLTIIPWERRYQYLDSMELADIWGIGRRSTKKLIQSGINSTRSIRGLPDATLQGLVGSYWTRLRLIAEGINCEKIAIDNQRKPQQTMQHAHTLATASNDLTEIKSLIRKLTEKLATRLRREKQLAGKVQLYLREAGEKEYGWQQALTASPLWGVSQLPINTDDGNEIYQQLCSILQSLPWQQSRKIRLVAVSVSQLTMPDQLNLYYKASDKAGKNNRVNRALDKINNRYGEATIKTADLISQKAKEQELSLKRPQMTFHPY